MKSTHVAMHAARLGIDLSLRHSAFPPRPESLVCARSGRQRRVPIVKGEQGGCRAA